MKNVHVLATDKPSRIYLIKSNNKLGITSNNSEFTENFGSGTQNQHIYITSDEEIKEGDWYYFFENITKCGKDERTFSPNCKKIILTTDQDLIKDGVQAIDDEFLEWFVKNPSCESVEVVFNNRGITGAEKILKTFGEYKIIIPQEESKQETSLEEAILQILIENSVWEKDNVPYDTFYKVVNSMNQWLNGKNKECIASMKLEDVKQETLEEFINSQPKLGTKEFNDLASAFFGGKPKPETLEEFAKVEAMKQYSEDTFGNLVVRKSIEKGAKWQQEQQDEFAIEFAEWCILWRVESFYDTSEGILYTYGGMPQKYKMQELLEQFKKK